MSCGVGRRCSSDLMLLWLWLWLAVVAPIGLLAWEPPYTVGETLKRKKKKESNWQQGHTCCIAKGILPNVLWWFMWEKNLRKNGYVYMYNWITVLYSRNYKDTVSQLHFNKTFKNEKKKENPNAVAQVTIETWVLSLALHNGLKYPVLLQLWCSL